jgi:hypothetical protein
MDYCPKSDGIILSFHDFKAIKKITIITHDRYHKITRKTLYKECSKCHKKLKIKYQTIV